jgi:hypothetical protein
VGRREGPGYDGAVLGSLDPAKVLVIFVVALIVLGPERLPRAARQLGAAWRELTRLRDEVTEEVRAVIPEIDVPRIPHGAVSGFVRDLARSAGVQPGLEAAPHALPDGLSVDRRTYQGPDHQHRPGAMASAKQPVVAVDDDPGMN